MALVLQKLCEVYNFLFEELPDPRVKSFFLMSNPLPIICLIGFYLYFVLKLGPQLMKNRPPFDLERTLVVYNLLQIIACLYLVIKGWKHTLFTYSLFCEPVDYSNEEIPFTIVRHTWIYFMLKVFDLLDTVFFVLRKKNDHVSFLHVYHHMGMCLLVWLAVKYVGGGHSILVGFLNCIVHMVMYFYYLLSAWDKEYKKNVWWKKHITQLQIAQFVFLALYYAQLWFQPDCGYPAWVGWFFVPQNVFMIILFTNFYYKHYVKPQKSLKSKRRSSVEESNLQNHKENSK